MTEQNIPFTHDYMQTLESVKNMSQPVRIYMMGKHVPIEQVAHLTGEQFVLRLTDELYSAMWPGRSQHTPSLTYSEAERN